MSAATADRPLVLDSYARLSANPDGDLEKIDTQHADNRKVIERMGAVLGEELTDNSLSAWKAGVRRPDWEKLLGRLESGQSHGVVVYHQDRLMRQPRDLERLLDLADSGVRLASAHGTRNLTDPDDRFILRIEVAHACRSSDDTSRRMKRRLERMRETGAVHGGARPFAFHGKDRTADKDKDGTVPDVSEQLVERERAALRQATADVLAGIPVPEITRQWNAAGLLTATGRQWFPVHVRDVLLRGRNAGYVEHDGKVVGRAEGEPIIDPDDFERLRAVFASRRRGRVAGERYLASGIVECGQCGQYLSGRPHVGTYRDTGERRRQYCCQKSRGGCGGVAADARKVDEFLREWALEQLSDPAHSRRLVERIAENAQRLAEINAEITRAKNTRKAFADKLARDEIDLDEWEAFRQPFARRMEKLTAQRDALAQHTEQTPAPVSAEDRAELEREWEQGDVPERRALLASALDGHRARLLPATSRVWNPDRVQITPLEAPVSDD